MRSFPLNLPSQVIALWVQQARASGAHGGLGFAGVPGAPTSSWPPQTAATRARLNLRFGNISTLTNFRKPQCAWWATVFARIRKSQGYAPPPPPRMKTDDHESNARRGDAREFFLSSWSYSPSPSWGDEGIGTQPMWSVHD